MKPWVRTGRVLAAVGVGLAVALGAWWLTPGQEVAPGGLAPEPERAVAAPPAEAPPPAAAAPPLAPRKDSAPVKQKQKTPGPQAKAAPKGGGAAVRNACLGLTGYALQACMAAPQQVPPERPAPPPQACPAGAVETMTSTLGLRIGEEDALEWRDPRGWPGNLHDNKPVRVNEDTPAYVNGDWETNRDRWGRGDKVALPDKTRLSGRLYVKEGRVYGRFTEARTPLGVTYPVCLELVDVNDDGSGTPLEPGSDSGKMLIFPKSRVRVVGGFK